MTVEPIERTHFVVTNVEDNCGQTEVQVFHDPVAASQWFAEQMQGAARCAKSGHCRICSPNNVTFETVWAACWDHTQSMGGAVVRNVVLVKDIEVHVCHEDEQFLRRLREDALGAQA